MLLLACTVARAGDITVYTALEEDDAAAGPDGSSGGGKERTDGAGGDEVVTACMPDLGQRIVFAEDGDPRS
jgi:hypothetical protein